MARLHHTLETLEFFDGLDPKTIKAVAKAGSIETFAGGSVLYHQGKPADALYFVMTGRLVVARCPDLSSPTTNAIAAETIVGYIRAGEPAGEMSLLLDEPHSATVYALRDSQVLRIDHAAFDALLEKHADLAARLSRLLLRRSRQVKSEKQRSAPRVFALVGSSPSIEIETYGDKLRSAIGKLGLKAIHLTDGDDLPTNDGFGLLEDSHDIVLLSCRVNDTPWYRFVLRHADRFLVFARRDAVPPTPFPLAPDEQSPARRFRLVDLVMLPHGNPSCAVTTWRDAISAERTFFWDGEASQGRIARVLAGQSVGVVLSGGGARAYAHIGAMRALREAGVPIDFTCGTSMGAIVAACIGLGWSDEEVDMRVKQAFVESNPLSDFHLPVVALTRGQVVEQRLKTHFGDALIEEMPLPFFCLSAELTEGQSYIHRDGLLRDALRASISLPGILPPIIKDANVLVDGGLINNFPTNIMAATHRGINIGIDVARKGTIDPLDYVDAPGFFRWVRRNGLKTPPPIVGLLMRAATTRRESTMLFHPADIMISPAVQGVDLRSWKLYDTAVQEGYKATREALASHDLNIFTAQPTS